MTNFKNRYDDQKVYVHFLLLDTQIKVVCWLLHRNIWYLRQQNWNQSREKILLSGTLGPGGARNTESVHNSEIIYFQAINVKIIFNKFCPELTARIVYQIREVLLYMYK